MAAGDALELALGLWRAPVRRTLLAGRPLPGGMTSLLAVAAGSHAAQQEAAARTGADVDELQEAARFFVQQVLLVDGADAYRTLGVSPDAPQAQLQGHFRLLQRWLHPDRDTGDAWDSAFASRVNAAWSRVRNPRLRRTYDIQRRVSAYATASAAGRSRGSTDARHRPAAPRTRRGTTSLIRVFTPVGRAHAPDALTATNPWIAHPATIVAAIAVVGLGFAWHSLWPDALSPPVQPATAQSPAIILAAAESPGAAMAPEPIPDAPRTPTPPPIPDTRPASSTPPATPAMPATPIVSPTASAAPTMPDAPATQNVGGVAPTYDAAQTPSPAPADDVAQTASTAPADGVVQTAPTPDAEDPLVLFEEAEHTVARLTRWLASSDEHPPPAWDDIHAEVAAATARDNLHARREGQRPGRLAIDSPRWQLGDEHAALTGDYRFGARRSAEGGRLQVRLVRREQRWLVSAVHMEPSP